jgi:hypothetical protein
LKYANIFDSDVAELEMIRSNISGMQNDVRLQYQETLDASHHGRPVIVEAVHTGRRGRPSIHIDPDFLRWAYTLRSTASISRFLHVSRSTVRNALLEHGIAEPQAFPLSFASHDSESQSESGENETAVESGDDLLDPLPLNFSGDVFNNKTF